MFRFSVIVRHLIMMAEVSEASSPTTTNDDDSCIAQYIEIVPLDRTRLDYCNEMDRSSEIKQEPIAEIKEEPVEEIKQEIEDDQYDLCAVRGANPPTEVR